MAEEKITQISPEQMERINQIYDERFRLEEQWRFEKAMEEKYGEGKTEIIRKMLEKLSVEEVANILNMSIEEVQTYLK